MPILKPRWVNESIDRGLDPFVHAPIRQLTNSPLLSWGVYCEQIYSSTDGRRIAFMRRDPARINSRELWIADLETSEVAPVGPTAIGLMASTPFTDAIYYVRPADEDRARVLVRLDLRTLDCDDVFRFPDELLSNTPAVSTDGRWFVSGQRLHENIYGLYRVDLHSSKWDFFHEETDLCNTHVQFEPSHGHDLLIQQNRGCVLDGTGRPVKLTGEQGAALYVIDIDGKNQRFLPLGPPHTGHVDGHQCWIGRTGKVLAAVQEPRSIGGTCIVTPGDTRPTRALPGFAFIHVSASADGQFIVADHGGQRTVYLGSLQTGKLLHFCEAPCSRSGGHETWEEPYLVSGNKHVIFNSERTGHAELYAATIPDHVMAYLAAGT